MSNSSWLSANKICSSSHSQNTTIPDCFNSYKHCKIYLVILTFANKNVLRKSFNRSSCSFPLFFCCLKLGSRRRAITFTYRPRAIRGNPASSAANEIARVIKTNDFHINIDIIIIMIIIIYLKNSLVSDWLTANCEIVISTRWLTKNGFFTFILAK